MYVIASPPNELGHPLREADAAIFIIILKEKELLMAERKKKRQRDIEKDYPAKQFVAKLRRLADSIEKKKRFRIQVGGERVSVPPQAVINIEHEREEGNEEIEFQLKWPVPD